MTESDHSKAVCREQKSYVELRSALDQAVQDTDSPDKLQQLEDILYDILEEECQIVSMLDEYLLPDEGRNA